MRSVNYTGTICHWNKADELATLITFMRQRKVFKVTKEIKGVVKKAFEEFPETCVELVGNCEGTNDAINVKTMEICELEY